MRGAGLLTALALMLTAGSAAGQTPYQPLPLPTPGVGVCPDGLCGAEALDSVFAALLATEENRRTRPVHILQLGDSHTAGDGVSGALRARLQARFGRAGRGMVPAGVPFAGYAPLQVQVQAIDWQTPLAPLTPSGGPRTLGVGLAGVARASQAEGAQLVLTADPGAEPRVLGLCGEGGPQAGAVRVRDMEEAIIVSFASPEAGPICREAVFRAPVRSVTLTIEDGPVRLHDISLWRGTPGVAVSNLGMVGASLRDLAARDEAITATQLAYARPQLIVLAFGTNEGFEDALDGQAYEALLREQLARLQRLAPAASLLILGAPDALRRVEGGGCSADGLRMAPRSLAVVRDVQRRVAAEMGVAFWDWQGRMGGECSADRLAIMTEPLMRGDRVHFSSEGADWIGAMLTTDVMAAYDAWKARNGMRGGW
ncbi:hypothetical protein GVN24_33635 [Rhizobium sp. CRIBSB]|nr:hypothetical protein [Rhizobium sp. CRIBSB]